MTRLLPVLIAALASLSCTLVYDTDDITVCDEAECVDNVVTGALPASCDRVTWACAKACEDDEECLGTCVLRDSRVVGCTLCILNEAAVCGRENGCRCEWDDLRCCRRANGCTDMSCPACAEQDAAWDACFSGILDLCVDELERCVAE